MTTSSPSPSSGRTPFARYLEIAMVAVGLIVGAVFYTSIFMEPAQQAQQAAAVAVPAPARS